MNNKDNMEDILIKALASNKTKEYILAHPEYRLTFRQRCREKYLLYLKRKGWPPAYLAGHKEFFGLDFLVNKHTLIPRPETELMVEETLRVILSDSEESLHPSILIDIGTGTGCIPIAIGKLSFPRLSTGESSGQHNSPDSRLRGNDNCQQLLIFATDISHGALRVAKKNAKKHEVKIKFLRGDLLRPFFKKNNNLAIRQFGNSKIIITANLPYLTGKQFISEPSIQQEPKRALIADNRDGLSLYKKLLDQIRLLKFSGAIIFLEIDPSQSADIKKIINETLPKTTTEIKNDLAGRDRMVKITC